MRELFNSLASPPLRRIGEEGKPIHKYFNQSCHERQEANVTETGIEWTDVSWNPLTGCKPISPGCANCYAAQLAGTRLWGTPRYKGLAAPDIKGKGHWNGNILMHEDKLLEPYRKKKSKKIFVCDMSDLFYEKVPSSFIDKIFAVMMCSPQHTFQVLTKRTSAMAKYLACIDKDLTHWRSAALEMGILPPVMCSRVLPNVWLGTSVENQQTADERLPILATIPARVRWVSFEPLLERIDLPECTRLLQWAVIGGESAQVEEARMCDISWVRWLRDQLRLFGIRVFIKQLGSNAQRAYRDVIQIKMERLGLRDRKGGEMEEWPSDLRVREWPKELAA